MNIYEAMKACSITLLLLFGQLGYVHAASPEAGGGVATGVTALVSAGAPYARININTATIESLTQLNGIGAAKAKAIVDYRVKFGRFEAKDDLLAVDGIGRSILSKNLNRIDLE